MVKVVLEKVDKLYSKTNESKLSSPVKILDSFDLIVEEGEFLVLVGPSGCGKSTLLRLIAGLEETTSGNIWIGNRLVNLLPPKERKVAMVFQNYALYPHLSVYENIAFGLRRLSDQYNFWQSFIPKSWRANTTQEKSIDRQVNSIAQMLQIGSLLKRFPHQLSGGQKQRVALARAISRQPQVFLLDEPLSNLDAQLRGETRAQIVKLQRKLGITTIYVTHDQVEAMTMGTRIAVLRDGKLQQLDTPLNIYNRPANLFVAEFMGSPPINLVSVEIDSTLMAIHQQFNLKLPDHCTELLKPYITKKVILGIRPEHLIIDSENLGDIFATIDDIELLGPETYLFLKISEDVDLIWQTRTSSRKNFSLGEKISLKFSLDQLHFFDPQTGLSILQSPL